MFTANLFEIQIQQEETQRRAAHYQLVKSLKAPKSSNSWPRDLLISLGEKKGQQTLRYSRAAR